ncbi:hypothetical protein C9374_001221 [Naegleria lovaniensis]|uniref:Zinc finger CHCC-type domain-containing protein n=1 Tax=Naegleria lovaniensis TaxID=51637 RepID=A0AA88KRZ3_NAELO|nr:uncharacterized protein C9374_001221 [Naegleria lovaniensis]KAG2387627.1 hypothetical protein C9374_001221 [Naegleria lovaniensis]
MISLSRSSRVTLALIKHGNNNNLFIASSSASLRATFSSSMIRNSGGHGNTLYIQKTAEEENYKLEDAAKQHWKMIEDFTDPSAEFLDLEALPPIEVEGQTAVCNGFHSNGMGHPTEYIRVNFETPERCKYCGVKFIRKH